MNLCTTSFLALSTVILSATASAQAQDAPNVVPTFRAATPQISTGNSGTPKACSSLDTINPFLSNNGGSAGGQVFFDVTVTKAGGITVDSIDTNTSDLAGNAVTMDLYTIAGSYIGNEANAVAWGAPLSTGAGISAGQDLPTNVDFADFSLAAGSYGVALVFTSVSAHRYTNGTGLNQMFSNADLSISLGAAMNVPFTGAPFTPRVWNGTVYYDCSGGATTYCPQAKATTVAGCTASLTAADLTLATGTWDTTNIPRAAGLGTGTALGIYMYTSGVGIGQSAFSSNIPFGTLCLAGFKRSSPACAPAILPGAMAGVCNAGNLSTAVNCSGGALGINVGDDVNVQLWYRDPGSVGDANFSNAIFYTVQ